MSLIGDRYNEVSLYSTFCHRLAALLEDAEDPDVFCLSLERTQRALLQDVLGDESHLVDKILKSIREVSLSNSVLCIHLETSLNTCSLTGH